MSQKNFNKFLGWKVALYKIQLNTLQETPSLYC